jgi:hypothetical protein
MAKSDSTPKVLQITLSENERALRTLVRRAVRHGVCLTPAEGQPIEDEFIRLVRLRLGAREESASVAVLS